MMGKKFKAFTLAEVMITLTVIGILAAMIIPNLMRDAADKARIELLKNTLSTLNNVFQSEVGIKKSLPDSIFSGSFLQDKLNAVEDDDAFASNYTSLSGGSCPSFSGEEIEKVRLKNGVSISIQKFSVLTYLYIDLNGPKEPNIAGIDLWEYNLQSTGTVTTSVFGSTEYKIDYVRSNLGDCKSSGFSAACAALLEMMSYDPDYIEIAKKKVAEAEAAAASSAGESYADGSGSGGSGS